MEYLLSCAYKSWNAILMSWNKFRGTILLEIKWEVKLDFTHEKEKKSRCILTGVFYIIFYDTWQLQYRKSDTRGWSRCGRGMDWVTRESIRPAMTWAVTRPESDTTARSSSYLGKNPADVATTRCAKFPEVWWAAPRQSLLSLKIGKKIQIISTFHYF